MMDERSSLSFKLAILILYVRSDAICGIRDVELECILETCLGIETERLRDI